MGQRFLKALCGIMLVLVIAACAGLPPVSNSLAASGGMSLDAVIVQAARRMEERLPGGTKLAIVSVASPSTAFSSYVIDSLEAALVDKGVVTVVDRANLEKIREEQGFQLSGEVSDASAKEIGKKLGAGAIVTGSLLSIGDEYRLTLKAINIESAEVAVSYPADIASDKRVQALLATGGGFGATSASGRPVTAAASNTSAVPPAYQIGNKGPAGGIVFYDKGNDSDGWRFLEAASEDAGKAKWGGAYTVTGGTKTEVGTGKRNTDILERFMREKGESGTPAQLCQFYSQGGYDDWFLPSKDELNLMCRNLELKGLVTFPGSYYWSSSEVGEYNAWLQRFSDGTQDGRTSNSFQNNEKHSSHSVRAIRQF
jgi:TolB-like protein